MTPAGNPDRTCSRGSGRARCFWTHPAGCARKPSVTDDMARFLGTAAAIGVLAGFIIALFWYVLAG